MSRKRRERSWRPAGVATATVLLAAALAASPSVAAAHDEPTQNPRKCDRKCRKDLKSATSATERYRDPSAALADGFVPVTDCDGSQEGAVGIHFYKDRNERRVEEREWIRKPEFLIYLPDRRADNPLKLRLVAIEYFVEIYQDGLPYHHSFASPERPDPSDPPALFGHSFEGPMAHRPYPTLWHYDLHVWAWARNPKGTFAHYNPALRCPARTPTLPVPEPGRSLSITGTGGES